MSGNGSCGDTLDRTGNSQFCRDRRASGNCVRRDLKRERLTGPDGVALLPVAELNLRDRDQTRTVIDLDVMAVELALCGGGSQHVNVHHSGFPGGDGDGTTNASLDLDARRLLHLKMACEGVTEGVVGDDLRVHDGRQKRREGGCDRSVEHDVVSPPSLSPRDEPMKPTWRLDAGGGQKLGGVAARVSSIWCRGLDSN